MKTESNENLISSDPEAGSTSDVSSNRYDAISEDSDYVLSPVEKRFLLSAERGDCAGVRR